MDEEFELVAIASRGVYLFFFVFIIVGHLFECFVVHFIQDV